LGRGVNILEEIVIEKTPKLGSMKETFLFTKDVAKEMSNYQMALIKESMKFGFNTIRKGMRVRNLFKDLVQEGEAPLASPDITYRGKKYWVLRYGPQMFKVAPPKNHPTGYTVFTEENRALEDLELSKRICLLYRVWEEFYVRPYKITRSKKLLIWASSVREKIFEEVSKRRHDGYEALDMEEAEKTALKELDDEVYDFHETDVELVELEEKLLDIRMGLFEYPSEEKIESLISITQRFYELLPIQNRYLERRITAWTKYRHLLERKYKVKISFDFNMTELSFAAFIDLMKYVLFKNVIPEGIITGIAWESTKAVVKARIAQASLNLLMHYGGLESLKAQSLSLVPLQKGLEDYLNVWREGIPSNMIRVPN
jgi:hypothetical protein